jgi:hypothetical protein
MLSQRDKGSAESVSLLNESVSPNCSVTLSVSADEGGDHDDEQGPAAGAGARQTDAPQGADPLNPRVNVEVDLRID